MIHPNPPRPLLERLGVSRLISWEAVARPPGYQQAVHLLDAHERRSLQAIERRTIARAALAGALSSLVAALAEIMVSPWESSDPMVFWVVVGTVTGLAAVLEIIFLYDDSLRASHRIAEAGGIFVDEESLRCEFFAVLARAALEMPNPAAIHPQVNPLRETPRWKLLVVSLIYKLKISATNILLKFFVRRALGRAAVRAWLPLLAIPVTAAWNAVVCLVVLREIRIRVFGPSLVEDVVARLRPADGSLSRCAREVSVRAVASCIVRSADLHPNLLLLLRTLQQGAPGEIAELDDPRRFLAALATLPAAEARLVMRTLHAAVVIDGRVSRRERHLVAEAEAAIGVRGYVAPLKNDCRRMRAGEALLLA